jgi:hypothetical protein
MNSNALIFANGKDYQIVAGPSKADLQDALFKKGDDGHSRKVKFTILTPNNFVVEASVSSVEAEDGSRESWNIIGYALNVTTQRKSAPKLKIYFTTHRRTGVLSFVD